uniref:Melatonin receptor 1C n=1 Tax=Hucho hucho TaxID=62062 RepID=A0A4W5KM20_9TELE
MHCQLSGFIMGLSIIGSVFNILAISINRYICHSLHYDHMLSTRNTCCYLGLTWLLTAMATVLNFLVGFLQPSLVLIHFLVPLSVVCYCYLRIWVLIIQVKQSNFLTMFLWLFVTRYFMAYFNSSLNAVIYRLLNQNISKENIHILLLLCTPQTIFMSLAADTITSNYVICTVALIGLIMSASYFHNLSKQSSS